MVNEYQLTEKLVSLSPWLQETPRCNRANRGIKYTSQYIHISNRIMIFSTRAADYILLIPQKEEMVMKPQTQAALHELRFIWEKLESIVDLEFANSTISSSAVSKETWVVRSFGDTSAPNTDNALDLAL